MERLTRNYGDRRGIIDLTFDVVEGSIFGFLGPNGAGKTTTIRCLMGLIRPTAGQARVFGLDCWNDSPATRDFIGFLPGELRLYEHLTGRETVDFFASFRGSGSRTRADQLAKRLDLDLSGRVKALSKGNRQKIGLVLALMSEAPLLILDEPSSGLDPLVHVTFLELLEEEKSRGRTVFLSSHDLTEVERVADRVGIVREGRIADLQDVAELRSRREREVVASFGSSVDVSRFERIPGVRISEVGAGGTTVRLRARGDLRPLLALLAQLDIQDLTVGAPELESIFLDYYGGTRGEETVESQPGPVEASATGTGRVS